MNISIDRLMNEIERYGSYGIDPRGGITRPSFCQSDFEVRDLFIKDLMELGLEVTVDGAANIWGRLKGSGRKERSLVVGSHLDTVPNGGKYDGALGVLTALELIRVIKETNLRTDHDIEIVSFTAEEPNDFNVSTMGSRSLTGKLTPETLKDIKDSKGVFLADAFERAGGGLALFQEMWKKSKEKKAFIELHIEQGRRLEEKDLSVAVVDKIVGIYRDLVTVQGQANHSGTTMMPHRMDALATASELILTLEKICKEHPADTVGTVGKLEVFPNAANIIPSKVEFVLEIRGETEEQVDEILEQIDQHWENIRQVRGLEIERINILNQKPAYLDYDIVDIIQSAAHKRDYKYQKLSSMAGHDSSHMVDIAKTAMVFVKSIDGKSHCPEEFSTVKDIEVAGNLMLETLLIMDKQL